MMLLVFLVTAFCIWKKKDDNLYLIQTAYRLRNKIFKLRKGHHVKGYHALKNRQRKTFDRKRTSCSNTTLVNCAEIVSSFLLWELDECWCCLDEIRWWFIDLLWYIVLCLLFARSYMCASYLCSCFNQVIYWKKIVRVGNITLPSFIRA